MLSFICFVAAVFATPSHIPSLQNQFSETELLISGDGIALKGSLCMPEGAQGAVPAMLLLPGSGPTDRDGNPGNALAGAKIDILKQIAQTLAAHGVASLRFDKRAMALYKADWPKTADGLNQYFSYLHFINDAKGAYHALKTQPGIDPKRVGILGHSEGGLFAMQIAADDVGASDEPWKLVLMGAAGRPLGVVVHEQLSFRLKLSGLAVADQHRILDYWDYAVKAITENKPLPPDEPKELLPLLNPTVLDLVTAYIKVDPVVLIKKASAPVLILNGSDDAQVSPTEDATRLAAATASHTPPGKLVIVDHASHNFKSTAAGNRDAAQGDVISQVLDEIVKFVLN